MKSVQIFNLLLSLGLMGSGATALAQMPSNPAFVDAHPYQSQTFFRLTSVDGKTPGMIQALPAVTVNEFKYRLPGNPALISEFNTALIYDKRNPLPAITGMGVNYAFFEGNYLATVSADGFFTYKGKMFYAPKTLGGVYFTKAENDEVVLVDSYGMYFDTFTPVSKMKLVGGNFFIDSSGVLTTIKSAGIAPGNGFGMMTAMKNWSFADAFAAGGNFFMKNDGTIVTIASDTGFFSSPYTPDARPLFLGGNYFVGQDQLLYTISAKGELKKNTEYVISDTPILSGYSFMRFMDGSFLFIDGDGMPHKTLMHVSTTGVRAEVTSKLPEGIEKSSVFQINSNL